MAVLEPVLIKITNASDQVEWISIPNDPRDLTKGESQIPFCSEVFIDQSDFRLEHDEEYKRFSPNQPVGLFKVGVLSYERHDSDSTGKVTCIYAKIDRSDDAIKAKTFIQWVGNAPSINSPIKATVRIYSNLFKSINPEEADGGFLNDINPDSLHVINDALVDLRLKDAKVEDKFQFQRLGYFCKDKDSTEEKPVFNLTVSIKEDPHKN
jgi:glutaminyl-tRNA synthetase